MDRQIDSQTLTYRQTHTHKQIDKADTDRESEYKPFKYQAKEKIDGWRQIDIGIDKQIDTQTQIGRHGRYRRRERVHTFQILRKRKISLLVPNFSPRQADKQALEGTNWLLTCGCQRWNAGLPFTQHRTRTRKHTGKERKVLMRT